MTIVNDLVVPTRRDTFLTPRAGTTAPPTHFAPRHFFAGGCMVGCVATGTLTAISPADALALNNTVTQASTLPAMLRGQIVPVDSAAVPGVLQRLRRTSGLSWGDVADALGVTRRTIHNWLSGDRIAGVHLTRLLEFDRLVDALGTGRPEETRATLLQPRSNGRSILDEVALAARPARRVPLSTVSVADQMGPISEEPDVPATDQLRRSSIRGRALPTRRSIES